MESENEIPQPAKTESDGSQIATTGSTSISPPQLQRLAPVNVIEGLMAANPNRLGGPVNGPLLLSHLAMATMERNAVQAELREARAENNDLRDRLNAAERRVAVLEKSAEFAPTRTRIVGLCAFLGPVLASVAIEIYQSQLHELAYITGGVGVLMLLTAAVLMWRTGK
jgi:hypothetical protein